MPELDLVTNINSLHSVSPCGIAQFISDLHCDGAKGQYDSSQMHKIECLFSMGCCGLFVPLLPTSLVSSQLPVFAPVPQESHLFLQLCPSHFHILSFPLSLASINLCLLHTKHHTRFLGAGRRHNSCTQENFNLVRFSRVNLTNLFKVKYYRR